MRKQSVRSNQNLQILVTEASQFCPECKGGTHKREGHRCKTCKGKGVIPLKSSNGKQNKHL